MVSVAKYPCKWTDAASLGDDFPMIQLSHVRDVRSPRTPVNNVDCVQGRRDNTPMAEIETGRALIALKLRSGLSLEKIASRGGWKTRSGVQNYFSSTYKKPLDTDVAAKLADALAGTGDPQISRSEIFALTGVPEENAVVKFEGASVDRMTQALPIIGTAMGAERIVDDQAIEQTYLFQDEIIGYAKRPTILDGRADVYAVYVQGSSMFPAHEDGELVLVETRRPPRIGDSVIVYLRKNGDIDEADDGASARTVLIKRLINKRASFLEFEQYNPAITFSLDAKEVLQMHRVMRLSELLS